MRYRLSSIVAGLAVLLSVAGLVPTVLAGSSGAPAGPLAGAPSVVSYQGQVIVAGAAYSGIGYFKFAVVDAFGTTTYWSNDGTSVGGGAPTAAVALTVTGGLFNVLLGDISLPNMTALSASAFSGTTRYLRVWFSSDNSTFTLLSPDRRIAAVPYALQAEEARNAWALTGNAGTTPGTNFLGTTDNQPLELRVNNARALRLEPNGTSPNVIGGHGDNSVTTGAVGATVSGGGGAGGPNVASGNYATIGGGLGNSASNLYATVGGGESNEASSWHATIGGGEQITVTAIWGTAGGGGFNSVSALAGTVSGGHGNTVEGNYAAVGGGFGNDATGHYSVIGGGESNYALAQYATIAGGGPSGYFVNVVIDDYGTIGGGAGNQTGDDSDPSDHQYGTVAGGHSNAAEGTAGFVGGGYGNVSSGDYDVVSGGQANFASASYSTVAGGYSNWAQANNAAIGGGYSNEANGANTTVGGGDNNTASGNAATVAGGYTNGATQDYAAIGGGRNNTANATSATVVGGDTNTASGWRSTVVGGVGNVALGEHSLAAGRRAKANSNGCFVWADANNVDVACNDANRTIFRSSGGYYIYTNSGLTSGMYLSAGGSAWNAVSDRNVKENFAPVDGQELLARLARTPITTWNYQSQDPAIRHVGPMAQDFNALLPDLGGEGETTINTLDADGVALAAIQGLYAQNKALEAENVQLRTQLGSMEDRVAALELAVGVGATAPATVAWPRSAGVEGSPYSPGGRAGLLLLGLSLPAGLVWVARRRRTL